MTVLNVKLEGRNPKEDRNPKPEMTQDLPRHCRRACQIRISRFGFPSSFDFRYSDFGPAAGYFLMEALVYIGLVFLLLGIGTAALYRCIDNSAALRRNAEDISKAVHVGELWRADVRAASRGISLDKGGDQPVLRLERAQGLVEYKYIEGAVWRRVNTGPWSRVLDRVGASSMDREERSGVTAWRWELELQTKAHGSFKPSRIRPLFTFIAVPKPRATP